jgi:hypothetical protein
MKGKFSIGDIIIPVNENKTSGWIAETHTFEVVGFDNDGFYNIKRLPIGQLRPCWTITGDSNEDFENEFKIKS